MSRAVARAAAKLAPRRPPAGPFDPVLAAVGIALLGFGVLMVFSASSIEASTTLHDPFYFLRRQAAFAVVGLLVMLGLAHFDYQKLRPLTYPALALVTAG